MRNWIKSQWEDVSGNAKWALVAFLAASVGSPFVLLRHLGSRCPTALEYFMVPIIGLLAMLAFSVLIHWEEQRIKLQLEPTSGPGTRQLLIAKNLGKSNTYSAFCEIIGHPNGVNPFLKGQFRCGWGDGSVPYKKIIRGESESLLIATFREVVVFDLSELILWEVVEGKSLQRESFRWNQHPDERLPSFKIRITITSENAKKSFTKTYLLGPASFLGPLQMIADPVS